MTSITLYHADWCGHCQRFKPEWEKVKSLITDHNATNLNNKINYTEYEATKDADIIRQGGIEGFPTIMTQINGKTSEYKGGRTADAIMSALKNESVGEKNIFIQAGGCSKKNICTTKIQKGGLEKTDDIFYHKYLKYKQKYMHLKYRD